MVEGYKPQDFSFFHRSEKLVQQLLQEGSPAVHKSQEELRRI